MHLFNLNSGWRWGVTFTIWMPYIGEKKPQEKLNRQHTQCGHCTEGKVVDLNNENSILCTKFFFHKSLFKKSITLINIWGFHGGDYKEYYFLGCNIGQFTRSLLTFWRHILPSTLKTGAICSSERPVNFYHATERKIPKESFLFNKIWFSVRPARRLYNTTLVILGSQCPNKFSASSRWEVNSVTLLVQWRVNNSCGRSTQIRQRIGTRIQKKTIINSVLTVRLSVLWLIVIPQVERPINEVSKSRTN
jgi:hypothetical protein